MIPSLNNTNCICLNSNSLFIPNATLLPETYPSASKNPEINEAIDLSDDLNIIDGIFPNNVFSFLLKISLNNCDIILL